MMAVVLAIPLVICLLLVAQSVRSQEGTPDNGTPAAGVASHAGTDAMHEMDHEAGMVVVPGELPPVNAFWSLTMYNEENYFAANPLNRFAIGDRDPLRSNADGSLDLVIQHVSPHRGEESHWLPAPKSTFNVILRLYWPKREVLDGTWQPPSVRRMD